MKTIVLHAVWHGGVVLERRQVQKKTALGESALWVRTVKGSNELVLGVKLRIESSYIDPLQYSSPGSLALIPLPELNGENCRIAVAAVPKDWIEHAAPVISLLRRLNLNARITGRVLEVSSQESPTVAIDKLGIACLALDRGLRPFVPREVLAKAQTRALKLFEDEADELLQLLDFERGNFEQAKFFSALQPKWEKSPRERALIEALRRIQPKKIVQFECGRGRPLREMALSVHCESVYGVESSLAKVQGAKRQLELIGEVRHGSPYELSPDLPADALALLIDCLPCDSEIRRERLATTLLGRGGFEWVLCIEPEVHQNALDEWASKSADQFAYRHRSWRIGGTHSAALLRRGKSSPERLPLNEAPKQIVTAYGAVPINPKQWAATLETFTKWTVDPRWLFYLPPGMASLQRDREDGYLEHLLDAFHYYRSEGIRKVVVEKKHMGSRAIAIICRDADAARLRFGCSGFGCIYTRTGRAFSDDGDSILEALRESLERARFWERFNTSWVCLDGEMLPWPLKAEKLIESKHGELLESGEAVLGLFRDRLLPIAPEESFQLSERSERFEKYRRLHEKYEAERGAAIRFAPFHLVATEGVVHLKRNHHWHMNTLFRVVRAGGPPFLETEFQLVDLENKEQIKRCVRWWEELSQAGEEGLVVKPLYFVPKGRRGFAQPAIKCRGKEHLRLVYGPDYDLFEKRLSLLDRTSLERRRQKHRKILKQLSLSCEAVERFVRREPIDRVEECVRGILALGSKWNEAESFEQLS